MHEGGKNSYATILILAIVIFITISILPMIDGSRLSHKEQQYVYAQKQSTTSATATDGNGILKINLKIRGIDYSDKLAKVWITVNNHTVASNINPTKLLDPEDDGDGIIQVPLKIPPGIAKQGDIFTACINILEDSDNFGDHHSCKKGTFSSTTSAPLAVTTETNSGLEQKQQLETFILSL